MALYLKCPKCGLHFMDYCGEWVHDDTEECYIHGPYDCPCDCGETAVSMTEEEYYKDEDKKKYFK